MEMTQVNRVEGASVNTYRRQISPGRNAVLYKEVMKKQRMHRYQKHMEALEVREEFRMHELSW